jgi:hypothetical protein
MWDPLGRTVSLSGHEVSITKYMERVRASLKSLISHVDTSVLFDISFPSSATRLPGVEEVNVDLEAIGHGLFSYSQNDLESGNHPTSFFLDALCKEGKLCKRSENDILWDTKRLSQWLLDIAAAWAQVYVLLHLLSPPGRGTEEVMWQHTNTSTSRRHLLLSHSLKTLVTLSNYSKTTSITGLHKFILRVIPHPLAEVITKLLRIVRPLEAMAVYSQAATGGEDILEVYRTYLFVSFGQRWDARRLSTLLYGWFMRELGVPFGMNRHRHFAQSLQRKFLSYRDDDPLAETANQAMGHGKEVSDLNYARHVGGLPIACSDQQRFETIGTDWIKLHLEPQAKAGKK